MLPGASVFCEMLMRHNVATLRRPTSRKAHVGGMALVSNFEELKPRSSGAEEILSVALEVKEHSICCLHMHADFYKREMPSFGSQCARGSFVLAVILSTLDKYSLGPWSTFWRNQQCRLKKES